MFAATGAIFSEEQVKMVSELLQQHGSGMMSVIDIEAFFKSRTSGSRPDVVAVLRKDVLPSITLLSATVPEIIHLLEDAGIPAGYPRGIPDVQALATTVAQELGPQYVIIKREFIDEDDGATTLHYVLASRDANTKPPVMETFRVANPKRVFGSSYSIPRKLPTSKRQTKTRIENCRANSIPAAIAAYLAKGHGVQEAVFAGFEFIGEMLKAGELFE